MIFYQRLFASGILWSLILLATSQTNAQVVINELVQDNRTNSNSSAPDTSEFIELYNDGSSPVNLSTWSVRVIDLDSGGQLFSIPLVLNPVLAAGDYYVIGNAASGTISPALIDFDTQINDWLENDNNLYELRNGNGDLVDALGVQLSFDPQYDFVTTDQLAQIGGGGWSQLFTTQATPQSYGRYRDGEDTDTNGRDYGVIRATPGASNNLPEMGAYELPDVDALPLALGSTVPGFSYSFVGPKVVDPTVTSTYLKHALSTRSPQGGNAIVAWDTTGGGNMVASDSLVTSFDIWAYVDTINTGVSGGTSSNVEATTYGIGTTDALFAIPDPENVLNSAFETSNGNTGVGWVILKDDDSAYKKLFLVDMNDGGDSRDGVDWDVLETIDLTGVASDWYRLAIHYDPATGDVVARYGDQVFNHTITPDMVGTFYVGFREPGATGVSNNAAPPVFDFFEAEEATGDFNNDGTVDAADYVLWRKNPGGMFTPADFNIWRANFGNTAGTGASADPKLGVPEPTSFLMLLIGLSILIARRCPAAT
jgi:hypothetical protein